MSGQRVTRTILAGAFACALSVLLVPTTASAAVLFSDDFEDGTLAPWTLIFGSSNDVGVNSDTSQSGSQSMYLRQDQVAVQSPVIDTSGSTANLTLWIRRGDDSFSEDPDNNEDLEIYYVDNGGGYSFLDSFNGGDTPGEVLTPSYSLPADARHANFRLAFLLTNGSGNGFDYWHIDDVVITDGGGVISANLEAEYRMEETWNGTSGEVVDSSGNSLDGTARNGASTAQSSPAISGDPGTCRYGEFDGNDDYVEVSGLSGVLNGTATMTFWIRTTQTGNDTGWMAPGVAGVEEAGGADDIFWGWIDGSGRIGISAGNDYDAEQKSTTLINDGNWHHVALTRDASSGATTVYVDGALENTGTTPAGVIGNAFTSIGRIEDTGGSPEYFQGDLDEVRVYDDILSATEVQTVMNDTHACASFCSPSADLSDSFEDGNLGPWQSQGGPPSRAGVSTATSGDGSSSMFLRHDSIRVRSQSVDLGAASSANLSIWVRRGDDSFSEDPDAGEDLELQYRNSSNNWVTLQTFPGAGAGGEIFEPSYSLPADALHSNFRIRLNYLQGSGSDFDYWHVDNVCLTSSGTSVDHYAISHSGTGVTCLPTDVTFTAHDSGDNAVDPGTVTLNLSTTTGKGDWTTVSSGSGTLNNGAAGDGNATYDFPGGETSVTLALNYTDVGAGNSETFNVDVSDGSATDARDNSDPEDPDLTFSLTGFRFANIDDGNTTIPTQLAGKFSNTGFNSRTLALQAIRASDSDPAQCTAAFPVGSDRDIEIAAECRNPDTCAGEQVTIANNGNAFPVPTNDDNGGASTSFSGSTTLRFTDDGSGISQAEIALRYPDAGLVQLHARYNIPLDDGTLSGDYMTGSSNDFVVRPLGFAIDFDPDGDTVFDDREANALCADQVSCAADATGDVFATAGTDFPVELRAVVWESGDDTDDDGVPDSNQAILDNAATPNFGQEASPETADFARALVAPAAGDAGTLGGGQGVGGFSGGRAVATDVSWDEVGIIDLSAALSDNAYLGAGDVTGTAPDVGRFIPDRLVVTDNDPAFRDATAPWSSAFTYMGQAFTYAVGSEPRITVTALNASGGTTLNYGGEGTADDFWNLGTPARSYSDATGGVSGTFSADQGPGSATWDDAGGTDTRADYDGTGTLVISGDEFAYARVDAANPQAPFDALVDLAFSAGDLDDGEVCNDPDDDDACDGFTVDADSGTAGQQAITGTELRFGRLVVDSAGGSELAPIRMPVRVEYWTAGATWNTNGLDSSTALTVATEIDLTNEIGPEGTIITVDGDQLIDLADAPAGNQGQTTVNPPATVTLGGGLAELEFAAPGTAGQTGWVAALPQLAAEHPYLQYDWDTDGIAPDDVLDDNPRARVTFGIFSGNPNWIHFRRAQ